MANLHTGPPQQPKVSPDSMFYQFTPEETEVMKECNRESFFQRSLPLSLLSGVGAYMGVSAGYLKPSAKWGPFPKVIVGGLLGYIIGKYSYQNVCAEKLMKIPNSEIGRILRERRGKINNEIYDGNILIPTITSGTDAVPFSTDYKSDMDMDMHKPMNSLDTDYRPNYDGLTPNKTNEITFSNHNTTTYDELRARNRQDYDRVQSNKSNYRPPPPTNNQPIWDNQSFPSSEQMKNPQPRESRNQYGDVYN